MPPRPRGMSSLWATDEEMAKKDDDLNRPGHGHSRQPSRWQTARPPRRRMMAVARFLALIAAIFLGWFIVNKALLAVSTTHPSRSNPVTDTSLPPRPPTKAPLDLSKTPTDGSSGRVVGQGNGGASRTGYYKGPLRLPTLGATLRLLKGTEGDAEKNRNVLFSAASLRSAGRLLPMACEMAAEKQNQVHFALMGSTDIAWNDLLKINGIDSECQVTVHDARPDHAGQSSTARLALASNRAVFHINGFMHPQAIIVDATSAEEAFFLSGVREQIKSTKASLIELPDFAGNRLGWIRKLQAASLAAWSQVQVDVLIHTPPGGSGKLQRLLRSIQHADLGASAPPHITIELPPEINEPTRNFLSKFEWPPKSSGINTRMLSLRHRVSRSSLTEEESSIRFLESFWPFEPSRSHILVLSADTEVSPNFFNYLKFVLLHHRYSRKTTESGWHEGLLGFSFASPHTTLDGKKQLSEPRQQAASNPSLDSTYLWQAPNSDAMLFMGERWVELHGYISRVLALSSSSSSTPDFLARKEVSKKHPAWLEQVLQLCRLRGYYTVYPGQRADTAVLGVHSDLNDVPEEYQGDPDVSEPGAGDQATGTFDPLSAVDMLSLLPNHGALPTLKDLPVLSWDGKSSKWEEILKEATSYRNEFRRTVGQCSGEPTKPLKEDPDAKDLFCNSK